MSHFEWLVRTFMMLFAKDQILYFSEPFSSSLCPFSVVVKGKYLVKCWLVTSDRTACDATLPDKCLQQVSKSHRHDGRVHCCGCMFSTWLHCLAGVTQRGLCNQPSRMTAQVQVRCQVHIEQGNNPAYTSVVTYFIYYNNVFSCCLGR